MSEPVAYYRMYAAHCAEMAAEFPDPARRASLLEMAQAWRALAERAEKTRRAGQQQRQSQPDQMK